MSENEEELDKLAWQVYSDALKLIELPSFVTINKTGETFSCVLMLSNQYAGAAFIQFNPSTLPIKSILKLSTSDNEFLEILIEKFVYDRAKSFAYLLLKNLFTEMKDVIANLQDFPYFVAGLIPSEIGNKHKKKLSVEDKTDIEKFLQNRKKITKNRIMCEVYSAGKWNKPVFNLLSFYYRDLLVQWKSAKKCYKTNKHFSNWEKMLAASFEDLPTDLLKLLGDQYEYTAMPSSIALEHAARICGVKPNSLGLRALQKHLAESKKWIRDEGIEKTAKIYAEHYIKGIKNKFSEDFVSELRDKLDSLIELKQKNDEQVEDKPVH